MSNELVIDVEPSEIVIALLEDKRLVELSKEKSNNKFTVGDIYLGKVRKLMPGLNAAFVDVGYEKDAFLHYLDLGPQFRSSMEYTKQVFLNSQSPPTLEDFELKQDIDKHGKITDVLAPGQHILVQIAKEPISTKGPRITSEISIAGRNLVLMPFSNKVSVSQKIKMKEERERLRRLIMSIKPKNFGVIVRTVAKNRRVAQLDAELKELLVKWETAIKVLPTLSPPKLVMGELNRTSSLLRDLLSNTFSSINVNSEVVYQELREYIQNISPEQGKIVKLYSGKIPILEHFGVDKQIKGLFGRTVTLKNGAYLIIEHTEALHVIDVNSGNRTRDASDQETNALDVNMLALEEIARQLRLRDMGGIIVVDFIDMHNLENRKNVHARMKDVMAFDRTKHNILPLSKFGLMQITRQRVRPEMNIKTLEKCPTCNGSGEIAPTVLFTDELEGHLKQLIQTSKIKRVEIKLHPYIAAYLTKGFISILWKWCFKYKTLIKVSSVNSFHFMEYKFFDQKGIPLKV